MVFENFLLHHQLLFFLLFGKEETYIYINAHTDLVTYSEMLGTTTTKSMWTGMLLSQNGNLYIAYLVFKPHSHTSQHPSTWKYYRK